MRVFVVVTICRGIIRRLSASFLGRREPLDSERYEAGADVAQHRLGVLRSGRPVLEGALSQCNRHGVTATQFAKGNEDLHAISWVLSSWGARLWLSDVGATCTAGVWLIAVRTLGFSVVLRL